MTIGDVAGVIVALATVGSLLYISRQVNVTRQQTKGQFLLALDAQFEHYDAITIRLVNEPGFTPTGDEWLQIWGVMNVFERISIMVDDHILDAGMVDRLYGFRLLSLIANDEIYQRLVADGSMWQDFIDLCYAVADQRAKTGDPRDQAFSERVRRLDKHSHSAKNPWGY